MSANSHTDMADGLEQLYSRVAFIEEVVLSQVDRPANACPFSKRAWEGFHYSTLDLQALIERLKAEADKTEIRT